MLDGHFGGRNSALNRRYVAKDKDNHDSEDHGREEKQVLCGLVEDGWLLEERQAACAGREEVEELPGCY
jgi:hypothetical protein